MFRPRAATYLLSLSAALSLATLPGAPARAAGALPDEALVLPGTSHFVAGVEVRRILQSPLYQKYQAELKAKAESGGKNPFKELLEKTGLDAEKDVERVVFAGQGGPAPSGAALVIGRFEPTRLGSYIAKQKGIKALPAKGRTLYISAPSAPGKGETATVVMDARRVLIGERPAVEAILASNGPGLSANAELTGLVARVSPNAALWLVADEQLLSELPKGENAGPPGLNLPAFKSFVMSADISPELAFDLAGETPDEAGAKNLADALRGFVALGAMQAADKPELAKLAPAITVTSQGPRIGIALRLPYELIDALAKSAVPATPPPAADEPAPEKP